METTIILLIADVEKERSLNPVPTNLYDSSMCVPDLGVYIEYSPLLPGDDRKPILTTPGPAQAPAPSTPAPSNNFMEGRFSSYYFRRAVENFINVGNKRI